MSTLELQAVEPVTVALASLRRDEALICRARGVNAGTVREYSEAMQAGATFPPVVVFRDPKGTCWLADGFHRCRAAELAGFVEIHADLRAGDRRVALLHAASANSAHGLRRTNSDKRHSVTLVLKSFPKWSDRKIGDACGVDGKTVASVRSATAEVPHAEREGADGKTRKAPAFNAERELSRIDTTLAALLERWPGDDAGGRERLRSAIAAWCARVHADTSELPPRHRRANGEANRTPEAQT